MSESIRGLLAEGVLAVTKDWAAIKKKEDRDRRQAESARERYWRGWSSRVTVKASAYKAMCEAYQKASGSGRYPANARQIMYAARPAIQEQTGQTLNDVYFTQVLLPDYIREHSDETAGWDDPVRNRPMVPPGVPGCCGSGRRAPRGGPGSPMVGRQRHDRLH